VTRQMLETNGERPGTGEKLLHEGMSTSRTPYEAMAFSSSQPSKEEEKLGWVPSCDGRTSGYVGRGCAWIEKGTSTTLARGSSAVFLPPIPERHK
jgi:hypothetical protein